MDKYLKLLKKQRIFDNLLADTFARKIKILIVRISPRLYYKINVK